jgi:thiol:disulfide interchange protein DsbG
MSKFPLIAFAGAAVLALACVQSPAAQWPGPPGVVAASPVTWADLEHTRWIADGRDDAPRKVYVFMDANCKYCTKFWSDARPWVRSGKVQLRHVLVAVIAPTSGGKAATLLLDPDPARRFSSFEEAHAFGVVRMLAGGTRHSLEDPNLQPTETIPADVERALAQHERLMSGLGLRGTPGIVFRGLDGQLVTRPGIPREELPAILGAL